VSDHAPASTPAPHAPESGTALATPEFDRREVSQFGEDDGHAVTVIGKMLVGFFFYSLLIMLSVAIWTMSRGGQVDPHTQQAHHAQDADE
jgi:hypothetical protein